MSAFQVSRHRSFAVPAVVVAAALTAALLPSSADATTVKTTAKRTSSAKTTAKRTVAGTTGNTGKTTAKRSAAGPAGAKTSGATVKTPDTYLPLGSIVKVREMIGADALIASGVDGTGIDVAVLDSGVADVPGLSRAASKVVAGFSPDGRTAVDEFGHGTHMAGIAAGNDGVPGGFQGVAPGARIVDVRVADADGNTDGARVAAGVDWVVEHAKTDGRNIRVLLMALAAAPLPSYADDPLAVAVERAWDAGIIVVVSAGNGGVGAMASPGYDPFVLAVGAIDPLGTADTSDDRLATFTSGLAQPTTRRIDIAAPGVSIVGLRSPGSFIDRNAGAGIVDARRLRGSGTSQAGAVVAGAMALLAQKYPNATPDQMKEMVRATAQPMDVDRPRSGAGRLRVDIAMKAGLSSVEATAQKWPKAAGLPTVEVDALRPSTVKIASGFAAATVGATGNTWTGNSWTGNTWTGNSWSGNSWSGNSWSGNSWSGNSWR